MAKEVKTTSATPPLPPWLQSNLDQYKLQNATMQDLAKKYGFDYSPDYAGRIAEAEAQAKRTGLQNQIGQLDSDLKTFQQGLDVQGFQQYMQQAQNQVNNGINSGIATDQNTRLAMNKQNAMADYMRNDQRNRQNIYQQLQQVESDKILRANSLYQERLQQGFQNSMTLDNQKLDYLRLLQSQDQFNKGQQMDMYKFNNLSADQKMNYKMAERRLQEEIRQFNSEMDWRKYEYSNMSATQKAQLEWEKEKYGEEMAWERYKTQKTWDLSAYEMALGTDDPRKAMEMYNSNFYRVR